MGWVNSIHLIVLISFPLQEWHFSLSCWKLNQFSFINFSHRSITDHTSIWFCLGFVSVFQKKFLYHIIIFILLDNKLNCYNNNILYFASKCIYIATLKRYYFFFNFDIFFFLLLLLWSLQNVVWSFSQYY